MCWRKRDIWKVGIILAGLLLLLVLMVWAPVSANAYEGESGLATSVTGTVQATPTQDATVTALNKEKLAQEVLQLKNQNEPDLLGWFRTNAAILLSTLVVVIGGLIGLFRWFGDRRSEREKQAEVRFQSAVTGLGDEKEGAKIGAAILLRTFLRPGYEQFYIQTFDLAVANLCTTRTPDPLEDPLPLTTLRQALIVVFKEAFPRARSQNKGSPQSLDASYIQLDNAYLVGADLKQVWMTQASLREANLKGADLSEANLSDVTLIMEDPRGADLRGANLYNANLSRADLRLADLSGAVLRKANLSGADLSGAILTDAILTDANLSGVVLMEVDLSGANFCGVKGLTKEQLEECEAEGAIIDEDTMTSSPPAPPSQSNDAQISSTAPAQVSTPTPTTDGSSSASSQPGVES